MFSLWTLKPNAPKRVVIDMMWIHVFAVNFNERYELSLELNSMRFVGNGSLVLLVHVNPSTVIYGNTDINIIERVEPRLKRYRIDEHWLR